MLLHRLRCRTGLKRLRPRPGKSSVHQQWAPILVRREHAASNSKHVPAPKRSRRWLSALVTLAIGYGVGASVKLYRSPTTISGDEFVPFVVEGRQDVSPTSFILSLAPPSALDWGDRADAWDRRTWAVEVMQPYMQIARPYTPLRPFAYPGAHADDGRLQLYVRRQASGEMTNFLYRVPPGSTVEARIAKQSYRLPDDVEEVLFLAGGTGIAPALQIAHGLFTQPEEAEKAAVRPRMTVLWASRRREDCEGADVPPLRRSWPLTGWWKSRASASPPEPAQSRPPSPIVQELDHLQTDSAGQFKVRYFIDEENRFLTPDTLASCLLAASNGGTSNKGRRLVLISGPDGFVAHFAGPKLWHDGREVQGPLGGVLRQLQVDARDVHKL